jgi:hypothetical protein
MNFQQLIEATGLRIVEGGPFLFEDFGDSWVLQFDDAMTAVFVLETQEVVFVEVTDMATGEDIHMWMNPKFGEYEKKVYDELGDSTTHREEDVQSVFDVWHKNQALYEEMPAEALEQMQIEDTEEGADSEEQIH